MPHRSSSDASPPRCVTTCQVGERRREEDPAAAGQAVERPSDAGTPHRATSIHGTVAASPVPTSALMVAAETPLRSAWKKTLPEVHVEEAARDEEGEDRERRDEGAPRDERD